MPVLDADRPLARGACLVLALALLGPLLQACGGSAGASDASPGDVVAPEAQADATIDAPPGDGVELDLPPAADAPPETDATPLCAPLPVASAPSAFPWSSESSDAACANHQDDDGNGYADCDDFACSRNPAVTVCGADAAYEHDPVACANGHDDDHDGLVDCADPDCARNPFHAVCPQPAVECACEDATDPSTGLGADGDGDGVVGCADLDCLALEPACVLPAGSVRVLFDQTLDETAAQGPNSDWIVDAGRRVPSPSNPTDDSAWAGALSSFGFDLQGRGFAVESLLAWDGRLSYGDATNPQDLSRYGVLVVFEPSRQMSAAEKEAIVRFVQAGGGLLAVANHLGADRDGNGWSAPQAWDDLFDDNPVGVDPFGFRFDLVDVDVTKPLDRIAAPTHPVIAGPLGTVARVGFYQGCTARLTGTNATATALVQFSDAADATSGLAVGVVEVGAGRVVFLTDSAIGGDGSDSHGTVNAAHDAWHSAVQDNRVLFLNAMEWLGER